MVQSGAGSDEATSTHLAQGDQATCILAQRYVLHQLHFMTLHCMLKDTLNINTAPPFRHCVLFGERRGLKGQGRGGQGETCAACSAKNHSVCCQLPQTDQHSVHCLHVLLPPALCMLSSKRVLQWSVSNLAGTVVEELVHAIFVVLVLLQHAHLEAVLCWVQVQ